MTLASLDFGGLGRFDPDAKGAFRIHSLNLPTNWEYIYQNREMLLKVDQFGPVYAQADPPTDIMLFRRDPFQRWASWLVWLRSDAFECGAFPNFFRPAPRLTDPGAAPDALEIVFAPEAATYMIEHEGVRCATRIFVPRAGRTVCLKVEVTNLRGEPLRLALVPALRPHANPAMLAPWDKPEWYLTTGLRRDADRIGFATRLLNMHSEPANRRAVVLWSDARDVAACEISHGHFAGVGNFENPQAVREGQLRLAPDSAPGWDELGEPPVISGFPPVYALQYDLDLEPGESRPVNQTLAMLPPAPDGAFPTLEEARRAAVLVDETAAQAELERLRGNYAELIAHRTLETPDAALDDYVNDWLPPQLDWACSLDRGWPSGMRGSRDSANDFTALVPLAPARARAILETLFSCQRSDGWFPRQYSAAGRLGKHDLRRHADAGNWVIELLHAYLCYARDFDFLKTPLPWLDRDAAEPVLEHALQALDFFIRDENLGEHGLCKIAEGDWLDSVNRAGLEGRGESVTITAQTIISLVQMTELLEKIQTLGIIDASRTETLRKEYENRRAQLTEALGAHAYNPEGYFSSVFNDDGRWLFSDRDPDGQRRVYGPANWFAIASGAVGPERIESALKELDYLKCADGYRLYWPPFGAAAIPRVGRGGSGDQPAGLWENGNAYNQGSHGFLGRALGAAGEGDLLYEAIRYLLPYDQQRHPIARTKTPPYAVVNCWQNVPGFERHGGMQFLTGSTAYALRMIYEWMLGIQPTPDGLRLDPCVPSRFPELRARFFHLGKRVELRILNPESRQTTPQTITVNNTPVEKTETHPFSKRSVFLAEDALFTEETNRVEVRL